MTPEEKQPLLKDLCARLPYLVKGRYKWKSNEPFDRMLDGTLYDELFLSLYSTGNTEFFPYLRPMSSMTEEEKKEYDQLRYDPWHSHYDENICSKVLDWLLSHHFDFRGLIPMGLALEAPKDMYKQ